jgi:hypothetical protein
MPANIISPCESIACSERSSFGALTEIPYFFGRDSGGTIPATR